MLKQLEELCLLPGLSGQEEAVSRFLLRALDGVCETRLDPLGNVIAHKQGRGPKILVTTPMDQAGLAVTTIDDCGMLRFARVGNIDPRVLCGKQVLVGRELLPGLIGIRAVHQQTAEDRGHAPDTEKLYVDIGAKSAEDAKAHVRPGDPILFRPAFGPFGDGCIKGSALDARAGCAVLLALLRKDLDCDLTVSFTVLEEQGSIGSTTAAQQVRPDIALYLSTVPAGDVGGAETGGVCLGKGPAAAFQLHGTILDPGLYRLAGETAEACGIPCQDQEAAASGQGPRAVQTACGGARTMALGIPCRYGHTPSAVVAKADLDNTLRLLEELLPRLAAL